MAITAEVTNSRILVKIDGNDKYYLQRANSSDRTWLTWNGVADFTTAVEVSGFFVDSYNLTDELYEYRCVSSSIESPEGSDFDYSCWIKFGTPDKTGYSFNNYSAPTGKWGTIVTPDDLRYTFLWGTDFKATNGEYFTDEQIQWFIDEATRYAERQLNITIKKRIIKSWDETSELTQSTRYKEGDYDDEESYYDFSYRKIQRYGMITTCQRPILNVTRCDLIDKDGKKTSLLKGLVIDKKKGLLKNINRPYKPSHTSIGISSAIGRYGTESLTNHLFYAIDYTAGYASSDYVPEDLRQIVAKIAAISLLNIIGDGLMSGFSSSSLSMDGISESFSSTQSATSAYFGARIAVYKDDVKAYITENKYKFGFMPIGAL